jgi:hypothetical protein
VSRLRDLNVVGAVILSEDYVFSQANEIGVPKGKPRCISGE